MERKQSKLLSTSKEEGLYNYDAKSGNYRRKIVNSAT